MPLTPEEEAQIEIDPPRLSPAEESQIQIDEPDVPGAPDEADGPVTHPGQVDPAFLSAIDTVPHPDPSLRLSPAEESQIQIDSPSSSRSVSTSGRGFGPDTGQGQIWQKGYEQFAENDQRLAENRNRDLTESQGAYGQAGGALDLNAKIEGEKSRAEADLLQHRESFLRESADLDQHMYQQAQAESQQYLNSYRQQIAAVRQMTVTNPIQTLGGMQAGGLSLAMFAQGFLAAQGIHIDVGGQVDRWVERSIHEQERRISQAESGAEDQLNLWKIAQETSRNDLEARQRYQGMVLQAMQTAVDINAARFAAPLAQSAAEVAKAKLSLEQTATERGIRDNYEKDRLANLKAMRDEAHMRVMERFRSWELAIQDRAAKAKDAKGLVKVADPGATVRDANGKIVGVKNGWAIDPNAPVGLQTAAGEFVAKEGGAYANFTRQLSKLRLLRAPAQDDYKERFGPQWTKQYSEDYRDYKRQKDLIGEQLISYLTGAAAPNEQMKRIRGVLADDSIFQSGGNAAGIDQLEKWSRDNFVSKANEHPGLIPLPESERNVRAYVDEANDTDSAYSARFSANRASTNLIASEEGAAAAGGDEGHKAQGLGGVSTTFSKFARKKGMQLGVNAEPEYVRHFQDIALAAIDPTAVIAKHKSDEKPEDVQKDAVDRLEYLANDKTIPDVRREYAAYLAAQLKTDPNGLLNDLTQNPLAFH